MTPDFYEINEGTYHFNKQYNGCWGTKIAVTKDGAIRPCIYSSQIFGYVTAINTVEIFQLAEEYRHITKDKIVTCKDCEFRWACFDCREIAYFKNGDLFATNPTYRYNPYTGVWEIVE